MRLRIVGSGFVLGLALGSFVFLPMRPAQAVACGDTIKYIVSTQRHTGMNRGAKAGAPNGMRVLDLDISCWKVSSIYVWKNLFELIEMGYYETPSTYQYHQCGRNLDTVPLRFVWAAYLGTDNCFDASSKIWSAPAWHTFSIDNRNGDNFYDFKYDSNTIASSSNLGFSSGYNRAGTERYQSFDVNNYGRYHDMYFQNGSGWSLWDIACFLNCGIPDVSTYDNDPGYFAERVNGNPYDLKIWDGTLDP